MIWELAKKEIKLNFLSLKFYISFILLFVVIIISSIVLATNYTRKVSEYNERVLSNNRLLDNFATKNRVQNAIQAIKPPARLSILFRGIEDDLFVDSFEDDPTCVLFPLVDWLFIVGILGSLLVVFLSYDSIIGEKEKGTLQLLLSNPISRAKLLIGKLVGGLFSIILPFLTSVVTGLLVILLIAKPDLSGLEFLAIVYIIFVSILFFSFIFILGLIISSKSQSSATAVFVHLLFWVILMLVIPNLSPFVSTILYPIPSADMISKQVYHIMNIEREEVIKREMDKYAHSGLSENEIFAAINFDEINRSYEEKKNKIMESYINQVMAQTLIAMNVAAISPYAQFIYVATDVSGTGVVNTINYLESHEAYFSRMDDFVKKRYEQAVARSENFSINDKLDLSGRPYFQYMELDLLSKVVYTSPYVILLLIYNVIAFAIAYKTFIRKTIV